MKTIREGGIDYETFSHPQWVLKVLADPWKNRLLPTAWLKRLTQGSRSPLITESHRSPGSWKSMEIIYENRPPIDLLDKMAIQDNAISMAARNRRRYVVAELTRMIQLFSQSPVVNVLGVGAGPGLQVQDAFCSSGLNVDRLNAVFIDLDEDAFEYGMAKANDAGFGQSVQYIKGDARDVSQLIPDRKFHIVKLIGIIEYLTDESVIDLCSAIREVMHPEGSILTHGIQDTHHAMPFLERVFNLKHFQRSGEHVRTLLATAGFDGLSVTNIPLDVYPMVSGTPDSAHFQKMTTSDAA
jgi:hypothetical protein